MENIEGLSPYKYGIRAVEAADIQNLNTHLFYDLISLRRVPDTESFHIQMGLSFPFLRANDLRSSLLIMITRSFFTLLYVGGTYARLVYSWFDTLEGGRF